MEFRYFYGKNSKNKYFYEIFNLDNNDFDEQIERAIDVIEKWNGYEFYPYIYINICCNEDIILPGRVLNGLKKGFTEICRLTYAQITTSN